MIGKGNQGSAQKINRKAWQQSFPKQAGENQGLGDFPSRQLHCPVTVVSKKRNYFLPLLEASHSIVLQSCKECCSLSTQSFHAAALVNTFKGSQMKNRKKDCKKADGQTQQ